ncbi:NTP transferase domain-containing protein [Chitinophaga sp. G-6-1-13]|uniref:NTP transferase domain-containing protein n=2 Tax=Chitinophaga fulva TaxID=2728842 RepID=A0A848GEG6_9BACT|nr:NTP transferase domain-containing protein [Chitinophaga fulva]
MDENRIRLLLVVQDAKFSTLLTIGDIQRAIIKNISLDEHIASIVRKEAPIVSKIGDDITSIKSRLLELRSECMPIVNQQNELVDVIFWEDLFKKNPLLPKGKLDVPVVIMAGGKGTRLRPITNIIPKPLVPVGEKPILEEIINRFRFFGVKDYYVSVNYKAEMIKFYFDGIEKDYELSYFMETKPLGTAGSLFLLKDVIKSTFFVSNCDVLIENDYKEIYDYHKENKNIVTIVASLKHMKIPYGIIKCGENGELLGIDEKPELTYMVNSGMYILEPEVMNYITENEFLHITDLIELLRSKNHRIGVFPVSERSWLDIGEWKEYFDTIKYLDDK